MKNIIFNWQKFLIFFGITFGVGFLAMLGSDEGLMYYFRSIDAFDIVLCLLTLGMVTFFSFEKKG